MNLETEKLKLIEWIAGLNDDSTIEKIKTLKDHHNQSDWWNEISEEEKAAIEKGLEDIKQGRVTPHEEMKKKYAKWL
ncbi:MAG: hypothetical protein R6W90_16220 [Ignavibacteriaceae bacterium]